MAIASYNNKNISFHLHFDDSNKLTHFEYKNNNPEENEVLNILNSHIGKYIYELSSTLNKQTSFFNIPLMMVTRSILNLQGRLSLAEGENELICRCFGKHKKDILHDENSLKLSGSGCGSCRPYIREILPDKGTIIFNDDRTFNPMQFHIDADNLIKSYCDDNKIEILFVRASGIKLFLELISSNDLINPHKLIKNIELKIKKSLGIRPRIILSIY